MESYLLLIILVKILVKISVKTEVVNTATDFLIMLNNLQQIHLKLLQKETETVTNNFRDSYK